MRLLLVSALTALWLYPGVLWATDFYVSTSGDDGHPGTESEPWLTIQKAADVMVAGDQVFIRGGVYNQTVAPVNSGAPGSYITYRSYPGEEAVINVDDTASSAYGIALWDFRELRYLKFSNLTIKNAGGANVYVGADGAAKSHLKFDSLSIDNGYLGILFRKGVTNSSITNCQVYSCQYNIYIDRLNEDILIDNNDVAYSHLFRPGEFWTLNLQIQGAPGQPNRNVTVSNNEVHHGDIQGIAVWYCEDIMVRNNHCHNNGATGIQIESAGGPEVTQRIVVEGNLCEDNSRIFGSETGIWIDDSDSVIVQNNIMRGNEVGLKITGCYHVIARHNTINENAHPSEINASGVFIRSTDQRGGAGDNVVVHNTLYRNALNSQRSQVTIGLWEADSGDVVDCVFMNNIAAEPQSAWDLWVSGTTHALDFNAYFRPAGSMQAVWQEFAQPWPQYLSASSLDSHSIYSDPLLTDPATGDFTLQTGSPCMDAATFLARVASSGSGTSLEVNDARFFSDGMGLIEGDLIRIGAADTVRVIDIHYPSNTLTLSSSQSWTSGDGVSYAYFGSSPDMGAFEYDPTLKGDTNGDGTITSADIIYLVNFVFKGGPPPLGTDSGDTNCDGQINSADVVLLVNYIFKGGAQPCSS